MKRAFYIIITVLLLSVLLTGCQCKHEWQDATCEAPKTCAKCSETEGEALGHSWVEATCAEAKHCKVCGKTEGEPLEHTLTEANYQQAATCTVCGAEVGEPLEAYFEKYLADWNMMELNKAYEFKNTAPNDPGYTVTGKAFIDAYDTFTSDETHEALDGYEWKKVRLRFVTPFAEMEYGGSVSTTFCTLYESPSGEGGTSLSDGGRATDTLNWCGEELDYTGETSLVKDIYNAGSWVYIVDWFFQVPIGYDGMFAFIYNKTPEISKLKESNQFKDEDEAIFKAEDTLVFRLD